jgi:hypothetical protein
VSTFDVNALNDLPRSTLQLKPELAYDPTEDDQLFARNAVFA